MKNIVEKILKKGERNQHLGISISFFKWLIYGSAVGVLCGCASAVFLHLLGFVTDVRGKNSWLIYFLPIAGVITTWVYQKYGKNSSRGNNLILEEIQNKKEKIPFRMGIMVLFSTILSHLFGASVGREGTAVQMGGSISEAAAGILKSNERDRRILLMSGISGGFGSVFGTPLAGTIFGMEVSSMGAIKYEALIPCFAASFIGDVVTKLLLVKHAHYTINSVPEMGVEVVLKVAVASAIFGLAAVLFSESVHFCKRNFIKYIKNPMIRPIAGGIVVIVLTVIAGTTMYNGIGTDTIADSFIKKVPGETFLGKIIFTSISLGSGFQGGEVTPLFYVGSTLGNFLAGIMNMPISFFAAIGLIAVFSGASNAPMACFVMGIELFGAEGAIFFFMGSIISYMFSGHHGIYTSQMVATAKSKLLNQHEGEKIGNIKKE